MSEKTIFLCGGQGSQPFGMRQSLFVAHPVFRDELCTMDQIAQQLLGRSVVEEIFSAKRRVTEPFDDLLFSHPAILMIEIALARALKAEGITPDLWDLLKSFLPQNWRQMTVEHRVLIRGQFFHAPFLAL